MERLLNNDLEPAAHVVLIAVAVGVAWTYWHAEDSATSSTAPSIHVDSSEVLSAWRPSERRVFLFVSPTCAFCGRSMDFYARLDRVVASM